MPPINQKSRPIPDITEAPPLDIDPDIPDDYNWNNIFSDDENDQDTGVNKNETSNINDTNQEKPKKETLINKHTKENIESELEPGEIAKTDLELSHAQKQIEKEKEIRNISQLQNDKRTLPKPATQPHGFDYKKKHPTKKKKEPPLRCDICNISVSGQAPMDAHIKGAKHKAKARQRQLQEENNKISEHNRKSAELANVDLDRQQSRDHIVSNSTPTPSSYQPTPNRNPTVVISPSSTHTPSPTLSVVSPTSPTTTSSPTILTTKSSPSPSQPPTTAQLTKPSSRKLSSSPDSRVTISPSALPSIKPMTKKADKIENSPQDNTEKLSKSSDDHNRAKPEPNSAKKKQSGSLQNDPNANSQHVASDTNAREKASEIHKEQSNTVLPHKQTEEIITPERESMETRNETPSQQPAQSAHKATRPASLTSRPKEDVLAEAQYTGLRSEVLSAKEDNKKRYADTPPAASGTKRHREDNKSKDNVYAAPTPISPKPYMEKDPSLPEWQLGQSIREDLMHEDAPLVPKEWLNDEMNLSEWRELRRSVFSQGSDVDKLAYKIMQELLMSPTAGIGFDWLKPISDSLMDIGGTQHFNPHTGGFFSAANIPEELRDPRATGMESEKNGKNSDSKAALRKLADNIAFSFFVEDDVPNARNTNPEEFPFRGTIGKRQLSSDPSVYSGTCLHSRYPDSVAEDPLFRRIFESMRRSAYG